jgi:CRISPR type III-B/RAMP module-associated protein Cmr5
MPEIRSVEQYRSALAWELMQPFAPGGSKEKRSSDYYSLIRGFPAMMQSGGIGPAVAFLMAKSADAENLDLLEHLNAWLFAKECPLPWSFKPPLGNARTLLWQRLNDEPNLEVWWAVEEEAIEFCIWLKRFSEAHNALRKATTAGKEK